MNLENESIPSRLRASSLRLATYGVLGYTGMITERTIDLPPILSGHIIDFFGPAFIAAFSRAWNGDKPLLNISFGLYACITGEVLQGLHVIEGTFDPKDFMAYGLGAVAYLGMEKVIKKIGKSEFISEFINYSKDTYKEGREYYRSKK